MSHSIRRIGATGLVAAVLLAGCGTTGNNSASSTPTEATTSASTPSTTTKVSANTASQADIAAAFDAAGVTNGARWAKEVVEYRPYDASDTSLTKLRQNLTKYNPGEETLGKILSVLTP
jgi:hypothetical protein